jgi:succinate--hydroxymethylglutarate CoA-transferase
MSINRNKKSINLNLKKPEAAEVIYRLAQSSQVLIENFLPGTT